MTAAGLAVIVSWAGSPVAVPAVFMQLLADLNRIQSLGHQRSQPPS